MDPAARVLRGSPGPASARGAPSGAASDREAGVRGALSLVAVVAVLACFVRYGGPVALARRATTRSPRPHQRDAGQSQPAALHLLGQLPDRAVARRPGTTTRPHPLLGSGPGDLRAVLEPAPPDPAQGPRRAQPLPRGARRAWPSRSCAARCSRSARRSSRQSARAATRSSRSRSAPTWPSSFTRPWTGTGRCRRSRSLRLPVPQRCSPRRTTGNFRHCSRRGCASRRPRAPGARSCRVRRRRRLERPCGKRPRLTKGRYDEAASQARKAARWWRWSPDPWRQLGDAQARAETRRRPELAIGRRSPRTEATGSSGTTSRRTSAATRRSVHWRGRQLNRYAASDFEGASNVSR